MPLRRILRTHTAHTPHGLDSARLPVTVTGYYRFTFSSVGWFTLVTRSRCTFTFTLRLRALLRSARLLRSVTFVYAPVGWLFFGYHHAVYGYVRCATTTHGYHTTVTVGSHSYIVTGYTLHYYTLFPVRLHTRLRSRLHCLLRYAVWLVLRFGWLRYTYVTHICGYAFCALPSLPVTHAVYAATAVRLRLPAARFTAVHYAHVVGSHTFAFTFVGLLHGWFFTPLVYVLRLFWHAYTCVTRLVIYPATHTLPRSTHTRLYRLCGLVHTTHVATPHSAVHAFTYMPYRSGCGCLAVHHFVRFAVRYTVAFLLPHTTRLRAGYARGWFYAPHCLHGYVQLVGLFVTTTGSTFICWLRVPRLRFSSRFGFCVTHTVHCVRLRIAVADTHCYVYFV